MKVHELITILKTFPPDHIVVSDGYEEGYDPILKVNLIKVIEAEEKRWFCGKYDYGFDADNAIEVVHLDADFKNEDRFING